ncbi:MAG: hypothetical protein ACQETB_04310 [Halobacteriota archaeon]
MVLLRLLGTTWSRRFTVLTALVRALRALRGGDRRLALVFLGGAFLVSRWSPFVIVLELVVRLYLSRSSAAGMSDRMRSSTGVETVFRLVTGKLRSVT